MTTLTNSFFAAGKFCRLLSLLVVAVVLQISLVPLSGAQETGNSEVRKGNPRMLNADSPYLNIHADDLVQWYAWNEETFALARKLNRPLMVSFGYTACYWCHVMQKTHFKVPDIAKSINENFIPVMVDRERRPVLDETYMLVTEVLTKRGGWPNTVFMTVDKKPFYGTGYNSPDAFRNILKVIIESWNSDSGGVSAEAKKLADKLQAYLTRRIESRELDAKVMATSATALAGEYDEFVGGFGGAPKFYNQSILMFLLQQAERDNNQEALAAVELTLQSIISGGIHDQIEGGLHRYTVDPAWRIPHFEKMLYDQALMAETFSEAWRITGKPEYARMARDIADYVLDDLTSPNGGFYATRDAGPEGREGEYYIWDDEQLTAALGADDAAYAIEVFERVPDGELVDKVILNRDMIGYQKDPRAEDIIARLAKARQNRPKPRRDEKIVVSWNGMMISAFVRAALILEDDRYATAALNAGRFIWDNMRSGDRTLYRNYFNGNAAIDGELVDYAYLARSYVALYDLTADQMWLDRANALFTTMEEGFADSEIGDYYSSRTASGYGRAKSRQDGDLASNNGAALDLVVALSKRLGSPDILRRSEKLIAALSGFAAADPAAGASILLATDRYLRGATGPVQYGGGGNVQAQLVRSSDGRTATVRLKVAEGWHVNANKPLEDYLVPTSLKVGSQEGDLSAHVNYPKPKIMRLGFSPNPLALLDQEIEITATTSGSATSDFELTIQACSDKICLAPDTLKFRAAAAVK